jgi:excisionase family DNA binding protein
MSETTAPSEIATTEELAAILNVSVSTIKRMRADGMPWHHWGRRLVRFRVAEVMAWVEQQDSTVEAVR